MSKLTASSLPASKLTETTSNPETITLKDKYNAALARAPKSRHNLYSEFSKSTVRSHRSKSKLTNDDTSETEPANNFAFLSCIEIPLFHPFGPFRCFWDFLMITVLLYTCIEAPISLGFNVQLKTDSFFGGLSLSIDLILFIDVIINLRTAYFDEWDQLKLHIDPCAIFTKYLKGWLFIDLLTCLPFQFILAFQEDGLLKKSVSFLIFLRFLKILRIIRIARFLKMLAIFDTFMKTFGRQAKGFMRLSKLIFCMLLYAHFSACVWWFVGANTESSWIDSQNLRDPDTNDLLVSHTTAYSYAWYWSVVTLYTTGYGDIVASNSVERWVSTINIIIGTCFVSYFIGTLTVLLTEGDKHRAFELEKIEEAQAFCDNKKLPKELRRAILTHIKYHSNYNYVFDESDLLASLPPYIQTDIHKHVSSQILKQIDIFQSVSSTVLGQMALKIKSIQCSESYPLFSNGDRAKAIYIQRTGVSKLNDIIVKRGDVIGEYAMISPKRKNSVICQTWSEFYMLYVQDIIAVLQNEYPKTWQKRWLTIITQLKNEKEEGLFNDEFHELRHVDLTRRNDFVTAHGFGEFLSTMSVIHTQRFAGKGCVQTDYVGKIASLGKIDEGDDGYCGCKCRFRDSERNNSNSGRDHPLRDTIALSTKSTQNLKAKFGSKMFARNNSEFRDYAVSDAHKKSVKDIEASTSKHTIQVSTSALSQRVGIDEFYRITSKGNSFEDNLDVISAMEDIVNDPDDDPDDIVMMNIDFSPRSDDGDKNHKRVSTVYDGIKRSLDYNLQPKNNYKARTARTRTKKLGKFRGKSKKVSGSGGRHKNKRIVSNSMRITPLHVHNNNNNNDDDDMDDDGDGGGDGDYGDDTDDVYVDGENDTIELQVMDAEVDRLDDIIKRESQITYDKVSTVIAQDCSDDTLELAKTYED